MKVLIVLVALGSLALAQGFSGCKDKSWMCSVKKSMGHCESDRENMARECAKSCGLCHTGGSGGGSKPASCGTSTVDGARIIAGETAKKDAWPWQISLYYNGQFMCGGSILSPKWVLTAAHCVDGFDYRAYQVVVGDYDRRTVDGDEQVYRAVQAFTHPDWMSPSPLNNDMALIELDRPAVLNDHVQPICLPEAGEELAPGSECYITGWGQYKVGQGHPPAVVLKQAALKVVSQKTCANLNTRTLGIKVTNHMICAGLGPNNPVSGCHGDSGGPFVCRGDNGRWVLQGSVSWGSAVCNTKQGYSVFAKISSQTKWIESYVY